MGVLSRALAWRVRKHLLGWRNRADLRCDGAFGKLRCLTDHLRERVFKQRMVPTFKDENCDVLSK